MSLIVFINEVFFAAVEGLVYLLSFLIITDKRDFLKEKKLSSTITVALFCVFSYWSTNYLPMGINTVAHIVFVIMLLSFITRTNLYATIIVIFITSIFIVVVEIIVILVEMIVLNIDVQTVLDVPKYRFIALTFLRGIQLTVLLFLFLKNRFSINIAILKKENFPITLPLFQVAVLMLFFVNYIALSARNVNANMTVYNGLIFATILLLILMSVIELRERECMLKIKSKFESQQEYVRNMETVIDIIRREKHDFVNHLNTIAGLCRLHKESAADKIDEYLQTITHNYQSEYTFYASGNDYVDGLLAVKSNFAHENGIKMDVDFDAPLSNADIDSGDLISVVSNIIDNAFDALCSDKENKNKILSILSYEEDESLYLAISNNGPGIPEKYLPRLFDNKFSTKSNTHDRGYGLYIVNQIVKKRGGEISVSNSDGHTEFLIRLKRKKVTNPKMA